MTPDLQLLGWTLLVLTLPGTVELFGLTLLGLPRSPKRSTKRRSISLVVVVPAHNQENTIGRCVESLLGCDAPRGGVRIVVVADNCTDGTADAARRAGAEVFARDDPDRHGRCFALDFAFRRLADDSSVDAVVVVDPNSVVEKDLLTQFAHVFGRGAEAAQCRYMALNPSSGILPTLTEIRLSALNVVRMRGRDRMRLSVGIAGNGYGLTTRLLRAVPFEASTLVQDSEYHLRLVRGGHRVEYIDGTTVRAELPAHQATEATQHAQRRGSQLHMIKEHLLPMLAELMRGKLRMLEPILALLLLPLTLHVALLGVIVALPPHTELSSPARLFALYGLGVFTFHVLAAIYLGKIGWRGVAALALVPSYLLRKLLHIPSMLRPSRREPERVSVVREDDDSQRAA